MPNWLLIILISVSAVTLFVVGLSLSLIVRGRHIDSEIDTNPNMKRLGITCTAKDGAATCEDDTVCGDCQSPCK